MYCYGFSRYPYYKEISVESCVTQHYYFVFIKLGVLNVQRCKILLELHKLLITHNDLKADNVVGFDINDVRIIDFGQSEIHPVQYYDIIFFEHIYRVFSKIFFALLKKHRFIV